MLSSIIVLSCGLMFYVSGYEPGFATDILAMAVIAVVIISSLLVIAMLINHIKTMYLIHRREKQPRRKSLNSSKK
jgi:hypothetical protein